MKEEKQEVIENEDEKEEESLTKKETVFIARKIRKR